jgi:pimeloyl-ACP methyl ester carboxylesterase
VVVHCHSIGVEQVTCYRAEVLTARAAAAAGFPVFRYHARGHGDSAGDFADVTLESLTEDALAAAAEAQRRSGATRVIWLGVRFGALAAAGALSRTLARGRGRGLETAGLALWEPVHQSTDYFRGQLRGLIYSQVAEGKKPSATADELLARVTSEGRVDVHGYFLHRSLADSARDHPLAGRLEGWTGPTFIAQIQARRKFSAAHTALAEALGARGARVTTFQVGEEPGWHMVSNPAWESTALVRATEEWFRAVA